MHILPEVLRRVNTNRKLWVLLPFFKGKESVLDFGCGDLELTEALKKTIPSLKITGVDITSLGKKSTNIPFVRYDGERLPFKDKLFDTVFALYVLHHCSDPELALRECIRVAKERIVIVESVVRHPIELPFMRFVDWLYNLIKLSHNAHGADQFQTLLQWQRLFRGCGLTVVLEKPVSIMPQPVFFPLGRSYVFELKIS